jgi:DNA-binding XRE family transcriptional regulator
MYMKLADLKPKLRRIDPKRRTGSVKLLISLSQIRRERGVTLRQAAEALRMSLGPLSQIENGCTPSLETALNIAAFINQPIEKIWALASDRRRRKVRGEGK